MQNFSNLRSVLSVLLIAFTPDLCAASDSEAEEAGLQQPPYFEGDIMGMDYDVMRTTNEADAPRQLNGIRNKDAHWPNGMVPYQLSTIYHQDAQKTQKELILKAMHFIEVNTCIRFVERTNEAAYLDIVAGMGCSAYPGKIVGQQTQQSVILHISHKGPVYTVTACLVGFYHEQARVDRDEYVDINLDNILKSDEDQFAKYLEGFAYGEAYDFGSVMHYAWNDFAIDETVWTIRPKEKYKGKEIGQRRGLSEVDIRKINKMYECPGAVTAPPTSTVLTAPVFDTPHRGCYYNVYSADRTGMAHFAARDIDPDLCTYVSVASASIKHDRVVLGPELADLSIFRDLIELKASKGVSNFKLLLSVGGADSVALSAMASDASSRSKFVQSVVANLRVWGLDGLDVVYQENLVTAGRIDASQLTALFSDLRTAFEADTAMNAVSRLALAATVYSAPSAVILVDPLALDKLVDLVHVVAYDLGGTPTERTTVAHHSPKRLGTMGFKQRYNMESLMTLWSSNGFNKSKLVAGIPFYGRGWLLDSPDQHDLASPAIAFIPASRYTKEPKWWPYYEICHRNLIDGATVVFDEDIQAVYAYTDAWWIGYNDAPTVGNKTKWLRDNGYGGAYAWDVSLDDYMNFCGDGKNPLLQTMKQQLT